MAVDLETAKRCRPLHDYVLVDCEQNEESPGGIYIPSSARDPVTEGTVLAVGPGRWNDRIHERVPVQVKPGDRVRFRAWSAAEVDGRGGRFRARIMILKEEDIAGVLE